eukprot:TRINITY_DN1124_c0_g1_i1.p1 TRINITY_DN1124_c0_g1~~TRINITY_DN1124_c0_g1_i1.p1  ORF type:complete len:711 (+),score=142.57 TRINITY_DN1124_c0_g1_i1:13-2145(+)
MTALFTLALVSSLSLARNAQAFTVGANIGTASYYSAQGMYCDLIKQSEYPFGSVQTPYDHGANCLDVPCTSTGWPTVDYAIWVDSINQSIAADAGTYKLSAKGNATVTSRSFSITNEHYDANTNTYTADVMVVVKSGEATLDLHFSNVSRGGFVNVSLREPQCGPNDLFHPNYIKLLQQFNGPMRVMGAADAVKSGQTDWKTRSPLSSPRFGANPNMCSRNTKGQVECDGAVPWEVLIELANTARLPIWVNVPPNATDDYVDNFAKLLKETLDPSLPIYVEWANEVWNWMFPVAHWNLGLAEQEVAAGDPGHLNYDHCNNTGYWAWRRVAWRLKGILDRFDGVFGADQRNKRFRGVYASQIGSENGAGNFQGGPAATALNYINEVYGYPGKYFYALAGAPYYGLGDATHWANLTEAMVLNVSWNVVNGMIPNADNNYTSTGVVGFYALAQWFDLQLVGYEGGPDYSGDLVAPGANRSLPWSNVVAKDMARKSPEQTQLVAAYLKGLQQSGMELQWFGAFWGSFNRTITYSVMEDINDDVNKQAIIKGIQQSTAAAKPAITAGLPIAPYWDVDMTRQTLGHGNGGGPCSMCGNVTCIRCIKPSRTPTESPSGGGQGKMIWAVNARQDTNKYQLSLNVSLDKPIQAAVWLNNKLVDTVTISNTTMRGYSYALQPLTTLTWTTPMAVVGLVFTNTTPEAFNLALVGMGWERTA